MDHKALSATRFGNYLFVAVVCFGLLFICFSSITTGHHCLFVGNNSLGNNTTEDKNNPMPVPLHLQTVFTTAVPGQANASPNDHQDLAQYTAFLSVNGNPSSHPRGRFVKQSPKFQTL